MSISDSMPPTSDSVSRTTRRFREAIQKLPAIVGLENACIQISEILGTTDNVSTFLAPKVNPLRQPNQARSGQGSKSCSQESHSIKSQLDNFAASIQARVRSNQSDAMLAYLYDELFQRAGFRGDLAGYHYLENQLLEPVLTRRRGLPVMLSLVVLLVGSRIGLTVKGLNTPGHFLLAIDDQHGQLILDPFSKGRILTKSEAIQRLAYATGLEQRLVAQHFTPVSYNDWLRRILMSLLQSLQRSGEFEKEELVEQMLADLNQLER